MKKEAFEYLGKHFEPVKRLTDKQLELNTISKHLYSDRELGFSKYDWKKVNYSHEGFYEACEDEYYDLFKCIENNKIYIPCGNELFEYR